MGSRKKPHTRTSKYGKKFRAGKGFAKLKIKIKNKKIMLYNIKTKDGSEFWSVLSPIKEFGEKLIRKKEFTMPIHEQYTEDVSFTPTDVEFIKKELKELKK